MRPSRALLASLLAATLAFACGGSSSSPEVNPPDSGSNPDAGAGSGDAGVQFTLDVTRSGNGSGGVASSPAGIDCGTLCSASFDAGAQVLLTASADAGSSFAGWSGDCTGTAATCSVLLDQARAVVASFALDPESLTVTLGGTGSGSVTSSPAGISCPGTCSAVFDYGTVVHLTAQADAGSVFGSWSGACSGSANPCSFTIRSASSASATFGPAPDITISGFAYSPLDLTVDAGTTLLVKNNDSGGHTVTSEAADDSFTPASVGGVGFNVTVPGHGTATISIPAGATSGTVIPYYCAFHAGSMATPNGHITIH